MTIGVQQDTGLGRAVYVEDCVCPAGHTGLSCQVSYFPWYTSGLCRAMYVEDCVCPAGHTG